MIRWNKNLVMPGASGKPITLDIVFNDELSAPVIIYAHGFNGFKDWGNFDLVAAQFVEQGFCFVKFNFSHNGTTPQQPEEFVDTEAYGNNNYSRQLEDLQEVIEWVCNKGMPYSSYVKTDKLFLIGHSLGGGIVLVKAAEEKRIRALATWASVAALQTPWGNWPQEKILEWERTGVAYQMNGRTRQNMPLYFQLYQDYQHNKTRLDVLAAVSKLDIPVLVCHGNQDEAVPVSAAHSIAAHSKNARLYLIDGDHVFGRKHPWTGHNLPAPMQLVIDKTIQFFKGK